MRDDVGVTDPFAVRPSDAAAPEHPSAPLYGEPHTAAMRNGLGTAALILGVVAIPLGVLIVPGVLAIVFGVIGMRRSRRGEASNHGVALAGVITGTIGLLLGLVLIVGIIRVVTSDSWNRFLDCERAAVTTEQQNACTRQLTDDLVGSKR